MEYMQDPRDLDYASPMEKEEYARWSDLVEIMLDKQIPDVSELQEAGYQDCYDDNPDDESLDDCQEQW